VLSTRVIPASATDTVAVTLQVAENSEFNPILQQVPLTARRVAGRNYRTEPGDYIARAVVTGLRPAQRYFYRFVSEGFTSPVGQFRTLPAPGDGRPIRFLHISCANEPPFPNCERLFGTGEPGQSPGERDPRGNDGQLALFGAGGAQLQRY
jgi:alkaline phosphatase D